MAARRSLSHKLQLAAAAVAALWTCQALAAEVEAKKAGVEVFASASNKSEVLQKLSKGESLTAVERKGMFWQVKAKDGTAGYVSVLAVTHKADVNGDLSKAIKSVVKEGRSSDSGSDVRARSAVMGVRGLREDDSAGNAANVRPNLRAVYAMEDRTVSKKRVNALGENVFTEIAKKAK